MKLKNLLLIALVAIVFCGCQSNYQPTSITVASYNLRNANGGDSINGNGWGQRYPVIAKMVQYHDFDIFGTQECFLHQLKDMKEALLAELPFLSYAPIEFISALTGQRTNRLFGIADRIYEEYTRRISTGLLNTVINEAVIMNPPPTRKGRVTKVNYATQIAAAT